MPLTPGVLRERPIRKMTKTGVLMETQYFWGNKDSDLFGIVLRIPY